MLFPRNKYLFLLLTLLWCLLILTGCQCAHEWTEADCLTAKACAKCGEAEGEPLGHNYTPATCTAPETCSRCALTRGEPLGHTYGRWELAEKGKIRTCQVCGDTESEEIAIANTTRHIVGDWHSLTISTPTGAYSKETNFLGNSFHFYLDNTFTAVLDQTEYTGTWKSEGSDSPFYWYLLDCEDFQEPLEICIVNRSPAYLYYHVTTNGIKQSITCYSMTAEESEAARELLEQVCGTWTAASASYYSESSDSIPYDAEGVSFTLNPDHTCTQKDPNGSTSYWWYLTYYAGYDGPVFMYGTKNIGVGIFTLEDGVLDMPLYIGSDYVLTRMEKT